MLLKSFYALGLAACTALAARAQSRLPYPARDASVTSAQISPHVLEALAFGQTSSLADLLYLQAVSMWGQRNMAQANYVDLGPLLQRVVCLDAYHQGAYLLAGTALTLAGMDQDIGMAMLQQGSALFPKSWRLLLLYGFNALDLQHDGVAASQALTAAAKLPDAPPYVPMVAATVSAQNGHTSMAIAMLQALMASAQDEVEVQRYRIRLEELTAKQAKTLRPTLRAP